MESDRPSVSRFSERPITRMKREKSPSEKSVYSERPTSAVSKSYSKIERPTSRRGVKTDITEFGISRPPTSRKNTFSRPPSAGMTANRPSTPSRVNTMSSANLTRVNSAILRNPIIIDRPVTQQGLVGIRPSSSRSSKPARQNQERKYLEHMLNIRIRELIQDIENITIEIERLKRLNQDQRVTDLIGELSSLQNQLAHCNLVLEKLLSGVDRDEIELEIRKLNSLSDNTKSEIEIVFEKRKKADYRLHDLNKEIEGIQRMADNIEMLDPESRRRYNEALNMKIELQNEIEKLKIEYDQLCAPNDRLNNMTVGSIQKSNFIPEQSSDMLEDDNKNQSEKKTKNNKSDKEGDIMDIFKSTFEKNKAEELEKLSHLEEEILKHLERISNNLNDNADNAVLEPEEMDMLNTLMDQNFENRNDKNLDELRHDSLKLKQTLNKLEILETKIKVQMYDSKERAISIDDNLENNRDMKNEHKELPGSKKDLMDLSKGNYNKLKEKIKENEMYRVISILEDKLRRVTMDSDKFPPIEEQEEDLDHSFLVAKLFSLTNQYNSILINEMKRSY
ncbi:intraflagellar transport protein 74 homolog isoform X2 [Phymastichus coffea]|uniref:intraflagellar transport protein 74 homolog isoform X2 n=1 Tax=Phymastichus coffea TaxID=108790 RepID=UPI00273C7002|nr:intraflagellar transport protein 74 homolog isoform X2 [Phymastichus coffea]